MSSNEEIERNCMQKLKKSIIFQEIFKKDVSKTLKKGGYKVEGKKLLEV